MQVLTLQHYLAVGAIMFVIGLIGFMTRRNLIVMFLCTELMFQGVAINLIAFGRYHGQFGRAGVCDLRAGDRRGRGVAGAGPGRAAVPAEETRWMPMPGAI